MEWVREGGVDVMVSDLVLRWARSLIRVSDFYALPGGIEQDIKTQFSEPKVGLRLWGVASEYTGLAVAQEVSEDARVFASSLTEPFCGLNTGFEAVGWLEDPSTVSSLALIPLRGGTAGANAPAFGLLVLASPDPHRFHSGMGTDFLARIGELVSAATSRLK